MSKNLKTLICCILSLLFVAGTVIAVFADSIALFTVEEASSEDVTDDTVETTVPAETTTVEETTDAEEVPTYRLGDVNFDGKITAADARLALRISAKLDRPTAVEAIVANVIVDDVIEASDARLILRVSAKLETEASFGVAA